MTRIVRAEQNDGIKCYFLRISFTFYLCSSIEFFGVSERDLISLSCDLFTIMNMFKAKDLTY